MSWYSKVFWSEGLFLRPHHLQQNDRYVEHLLEAACRPGHALSVGLLASGDRSRSCPAEQVLAAPGRRRDARRHAVRLSDRRSVPGPDRRAGYCRRPDRLAVDAGRGAEHARDRRQAMPTARAGTSRGAETVHRLDLRSARRGGDRHRAIRGWPSSCAGPRSPATSASESRACWKFRTGTSCSTRNSSRRC